MDPYTTPEPVLDAIEPEIRARLAQREAEIARGASVGRVTAAGLAARASSTWRQPARAPGRLGHPSAVRTTGSRVARRRRATANRVPSGEVRRIR